MPTCTVCGATFDRDEELRAHAQSSHHTRRGAGATAGDDLPPYED